MLTSPDTPTAPAPDHSLCSECGRGRLRRSHRKNALEVVRSWFGYFPYRCPECSGRVFWKREPSHSPPKPDNRPEARHRIRHRRFRELLLYVVAIAGFVAMLLYIIREPSPQ